MLNLSSWWNDKWKSLQYFQIMFKVNLGWKRKKEITINGKHTT